MAKIIAWPPSASEYPGVATYRVHAEVIRDLVYDRSADKSPLVSSVREGERIISKQMWHVCDKAETFTDPNVYTRGAAGANSDWSRDSVGTGVGQARGVSSTKRMTFDQFTQNFEEDLEVHNDNDYMKAFGVAREYAYQLVKKAKRCALMKERRNVTDVLYCVDSRNTYPGVTTTCLTTSIEAVANAAQDPSFSRPFVEQMYLNSETAKFGHAVNCFRAEDMLRIYNASASTFGTIGTAATNKAHASGNRPTIQIRMNEDLISKYLEVLSGNGDDAEAMPDVVWLPTSPYSHLGGWGSVASPSGQLGALSMQQQAMLETIKRAIRSYESQLGPLAFGRSRNIFQANNAGTSNGVTIPPLAVDGSPGTAGGPIAGRTAVSPNGNPGYMWGFQIDMLENRTFRAFTHTPLNPRGDSAIGYIKGEDGIELLHPQSASLVIGINNV